MQEQEAIRRCQAGDIPALGILFELHHRAIFRTAYGILRDYDLAEDITQQAFIELFSSIKRYDLKRPFPPWLHRIAVNRSLDELRRPKRRDVPLDAAREIPSPSDGPEQEAEQSELSTAIGRALGDLDPKHRAVIVLRYYQGFSEAEIAVALHCRRGTVKSRLNTARRRLREIVTAHASSFHAEGLSMPESPASEDLGSRNSGVVTAEEELR